MKKGYGWFILLVVVVFLVAACGPQFATPTPAGEDLPANTAAPATETAPSEPSAVAEPTQPEPPSTGELPVDPDDWHALGSPDAPVTMIDFSDFQ
ncbi:MAG: hypothetical protein PVF47_17480 [Anaerolineae bacterium]|jgi:protein-disulfide isomerase